MLVDLRVMMRWSSTGRSALCWGVVACALACGGAEKKGTLFEPIESPGEVPDVPPDTMTSALTPVEVPPMTGAGASTNETTPTDIFMVPSSTPQEPPGCKPANGVSGTPTTISEAIVLMDTLPRPTSLACFLEALERPLTLYMTKSDRSLQPSPGERSPRTFILRGNFEMSIVLDGDKSNTLEFGFRPEPSRSIKAEVEFPLTKDVSETTLFDRVQVTPRTTKCGACHVGEGHQDYPGFPLGVFISDVLAPFELDEIKLDALKAEHASCDKAAEPYRCGLLSALLDHGDVVQGLLE